MMLLRHLVLSGLCLALVQAAIPLQELYKNYKIDKTDDLDKLRSELPEINPGLMGVVTDKDWDRYTVKDATPPRVSVPSMNDACVEGKMMTSINGRPIYAFQGIRYGKAPVGDLRFRPTEEFIYTFGEAEKSEYKSTDGNSSDVCSDNLIIANRLAPMCIQNGMLNHDMAGDEDCLFLNVYSPVDPNTIQESLPVMLWIHGGAFTSGDSSMYLPTKLLEHDVILVTIHYRLGAFGFYFLDNEKAPGNAALYDQVESLRWVNKHIADFGGNKNRVTAFGESAGAVSVNFMMVLPQTEGLVHNVIAESGSLLEHWAYEEDPMEGSFIIGRSVGCIDEGEEIDPDDDQRLDKLADCMKLVTPYDLNKAMSNLVSSDRYNGMMGFRGCSPVRQNPEKIKNPILTTTPKELLQFQEDREVNFMTGANRNEGSFVVGIMYSAYLVKHGLVNDSLFLREEMIPTVMSAFGVEDDTHGLSISMASKYIAGIDLADFESMAPGMIDLVGVLFLKAGGWTTAKQHSYYKKGRNFFYSFEFESDDSMFFWLLGPNYPFPAGITHSDELMYLFSFPAKMDGNQVDVMNRMTKLWTNFAKYGDPTPDQDDSWKEPSLRIPKWKEVTHEEYNFMLMKDEFIASIDYPSRWTISTDSKFTTTSTSTTTTTENSGETTTGPSWDDYNKLDDEKDNYMISMIVFVICFVLTCGTTFYYAYKARR